MDTQLIKTKLPIVDNMFSHCGTTSDRPSDIMEWDRLNLENYNYIFLTDTSLHRVNEFKNKRKYAWLVESPEFHKVYYSWLMNNHDKFDKIFTFKKEILESQENAIFLPIGGCWINNSDRQTYFDSKNKLISMVSSGKNFTSGHRLRKEIIDVFSNKFDLYGRTYNPINNKIESLKDYMFQIVVENTREDYYFTEKLIDCFQTGVIPIYWGCPSICNFFDGESILQFNTIDELEKIIDSISYNFYFSKKNNIKKNFNISKQFLCAEEYLIKNYKNDF